MSEDKTTAAELARLDALGLGAAAAFARECVAAGAELRQNRATDIEPGVWLEYTATETPAGLGTGSTAPALSRKAAPPEAAPEPIRRPARQGDLFRK